MHSEIKNCDNSMKLRIGPLEWSCDWNSQGPLSKLWSQKGAAAKNFNAGTIVYGGGKELETTRPLNAGGEPRGEKDGVLSIVWQEAQGSA